MERVCNECLFAVNENRAPNTRTCFRFPPVPILTQGQLVGQMGVTMLRPVVQLTETCGEFKERPARLRTL